MRNQQELTNYVVAVTEPKELTSMIRHHEVYTMLKLEDEESNRPVLDTLYRQIEMAIDDISEKINARMNGEYSWEHKETNLFTSEAEQTTYLEEHNPNGLAINQFFTDGLSVERLYLSDVAGKVYKDIVERNYTDTRIAQELD